ncbi:MAG: hypothetical protein HY290_19070 [Planctomycetia bacterium]|nr:hypothetical protein [Planctomycetia bacterium]
MPEPNLQPQPRTISGKWVVLGMIAFGLFLTGGIWVYAQVELAPFQPLARAIKTEFPASKPHVKGGRPRNKPALLRVVMEVDFAPTESDPRVATIADRVIALARQHVNLSEYERFELHLVRYVSEKTPEHLTIEKKVSELID